MLPGKFPSLLCNGSLGIGVGIATNLPSHNLTEVVDAVVALIENPDLDVADLYERIKGPDFPTGAIICGYQGIRDYFKTGRGKIKVRARTDIEKNQRGDRETIVVTEIPYQVNKSSLIEKIADLVRDKHCYCYEYNLFYSYRYFDSNSYRNNH